MYRIPISLIILLLVACGKFDGKITKMENDCKVDYYEELVPCYYLENSSSSKLLKFTIKRTAKAADGSKEFFDSYKLNPGEKVKIGSAFWFNGSEYRIDHTFEIVGQQELTATE